jgi:hypothetical protein
LFIALSVALAAFVAAWAANQYRTEPGMGYIATVMASIGAGAALAVYGSRFQRKTKRL